MPNIRCRLHLALLAALLCCACAATPEASRDDDATAKRFESAPRAAIIYVYRDDGPSDGVATLWVDGRLIGQSLHNTYFRIPARPGHNVITVSGQDVGRVEINTQSEGVYFIAMNVTGSGEGASHTIFRPVAPDTGKAGIAKCCSLLETWRPGQWRIPF
jgi:hypothetical protein